MRRRKRPYRPPVEADDTTPVITLQHLRLRNRAIAVLREAMLSPAEIASLNAGDVEFGPAAVAVRGRWIRCERTSCYLECHLDMLPDASGSAPLFLSRRLQRISTSQVRRVV